jgi:hypothetical protein
VWVVKRRNSGRGHNRSWAGRRGHDRGWARRGHDGGLTGMIDCFSFSCSSFGSRGWGSAFSLRRGSARGRVERNGSATKGNLSRRCVRVKTRSKNSRARKSREGRRSEDRSQRSRDGSRRSEEGSRCSRSRNHGSRSWNQRSGDWRSLGN